MEKSNLKKLMPNILLILLLILLVARLLGLDIAWYWIVSPVWIPVVLIILFTLLSHWTGRLSTKLRKKQLKDLAKAKDKNKCKNC